LSVRRKPGTVVKPLGGYDMKKLLAAIVAGMFAVTATAPVFAADKKDEAKKEQKKGEGKKKAEPKKKGEDKKKAEPKKKGEDKKKK
jgi:Spy/CpxP family protein refolding chaperone